MWNPLTFFLTGMVSSNYAISASREIWSIPRYGINGLLIKCDCIATILTRYSIGTVLTRYCISIFRCTHDKPVVPRTWHLSVSIQMWDIESEKSSLLFYPRPLPTTISAVMYGVSVSQWLNWPGESTREYIEFLDQEIQNAPFQIFESE